MITFIIPGKPVPQERRVQVRGGWSFDPPKSRAAKKAVCLIAMSTRKGNVKASDHSFIVEMLFCGPHWGADVDNLSKLVLDALKGIWWKDDHQVTELNVRKVRVPKGDEQTIVRIEEMVPEALEDLPNAKPL